MPSREPREPHPAEEVADRRPDPGAPFDIGVPLHRAPRARSALVPGDAAHPPLLSRRGFLALSAAAAATAALARSAGVRGQGRAGGTRLRGRRLSTADLDRIERVMIHPGLGFGRVGDSADAFFMGPEVSGATPPPPRKLRDASGAVARQAARFRLYGYDANGQVVGELTSTDAEIEWGVHLVNSKAAWYRFGRAMDIPEAPSVGLRNASVANRRRLVLDARLRTIAPGQTATLTARAKGVEMLLGELLTDAAGRLVVLPGRGRARSWQGRPVTTFANNDTWLDDVADGPVTATIHIGERTIQARSAWVATGPPNYAPGLATGWRTMHDLVENTWAQAGMLPADPSVSFQAHIRPLFARLAALQWVNAGVLRDWGWKSGQDLSDPVFLARLADPSATNRPFRRGWARRFREIETGTAQPDRLPPILGDAAGLWTSPRAWIGPTPLQHHRLDEWAAGRFSADSIQAPPVPRNLSRLPLGERPGSLDRASLEGCLGEAFDPGCELPWVLRRRSMWADPYRLKVRKTPEPDLGPTLTPAEALAFGGPARGAVPGGLTRWLAVPWHTDTVNCRSGYRAEIDPLLDTFWAARVPNHVLTQRDYAIVMDTTRPLAARRAAFRRRQTWLRGVVTSDYGQTLNRMVDRWGRMGFVVERAGPSSAAFPDRIWVEQSRLLPEPRATGPGRPAILPREAEGPAPELL